LKFGDGTLNCQLQQIPSFFIEEEYLMEPVSGIISGAVCSPSAAADSEAPPRVQQSEEKTQGGPTVSARDEYIPEETQEPSGLYWLGKAEDGKPKVYFDDPERDKGAGGLEKEVSGSKVESGTCNTDKVDREIEELKKEREELERQINSETDDTKIVELEKELAQVEVELRQKDSDAYRRQHAVYS